MVDPYYNIPPSVIESGTPTLIRVAIVLDGSQ